MSSSCAKPCAHHTVAVVAAAFATNGRANVAPAASPIELRSTDRRLTFLMALPSCSNIVRPLRGRTFLSGANAGPVRRTGQLLSGFRARLPRRLVHSVDAPAVAHAGAVDPVDPGDRAIPDCKGERRLGVEVERQCQ